MIKQLSIQNYAIIDQLEISFDQSLNTITGETGAGKSILLGALSLILGERADLSSLLNDKEKCIIEGHFQIANYKLESFFQANDLDYDPYTIIRREILPSGKSRAFINDTPVALTVLKELGRQLVNVHSQHQTIALNTSNFQLQLIDALAEVDAEKKDFAELLQHYKQKEKDLQELLLKNKEEKLDLDYLQFQVQELEEIPLEEIDKEAIESDLQILENAEEIQLNLTKLTAMLSGEELSIEDKLRAADQLMVNLSKVNPKFEQLSERFNSMLIELQDLNNELEIAGNDVEIDDERLEALKSQLNIFYRLEKKHQVEGTEALLEIKEELSKKIEWAQNADKKIAAIEKEIAGIGQQLLKVGKSISTKRKACLPQIKEKAQALLSDMSMPHAEIHLEIEQLPVEKAQSSGLDKVEIFFTANKGTKPQALKKVASGGELSRLMLALKSIVAEGMALPTLIFDEIDAGISGETAHRVGAIMQKLAQKHQVICITHLPQMASKGKKHFFVYKEVLADQTRTRIKALENEERVEELAKMLSGKDLTAATLENARELLNQ